MQLYSGFNEGKERCVSSIGATVMPPSAARIYLHRQRDRKGEKLARQQLSRHVHVISEVVVEIIKWNGFCTTPIQLVSLCLLMCIRVEREFLILN